jgi:DNA-binding response OmpR family regulator
MMDSGVRIRVQSAAEAAQMPSRRGYRSDPWTRTVDNNTRRLRQKLEIDASHPSHLLTVHGVVHKFVP